MADLALPAPATARDAAVDRADKGPGRMRRIAAHLTEANVVVVTALSFFVGLCFGALLIIVTTPALLHLWGSIFSQSIGNFFPHLWYVIRFNAAAIWGNYLQLFTGSIFDPRSVWAAIQHPGNKSLWASALAPMSETLTYATPLILAGLGISIGFRTSLFNIGGAGQIIAGAIMATWVATSVSLPLYALLPLEMAAGILGGLVVAGFAGVLKAYSGAHEVITTMMLNKIMYYLLIYLLIHPPIQQPGSSDGRSKQIPAAGTLPHLLNWISPALRVNWGLVIALCAAVLVWWFMERGTAGFRFRVVGANPDAARTAGINSKHIIVLALCVSGALVGLAGMTQVSGVNGYMDSTFGGTIGFDAITVALLARNKPIGVVLGAILFGALVAGGHQMQAFAPGNLPIDYSLAQVIQAVIVFCVATPALIIEVFRLKDAGAFTSAVKTQGWA